jgi:flagellar biosynthesis protein FlhF
MPYTILSGPDVTRLMSGAVQQLGPDAVVVAIRRVRGTVARKFVLEAADPATAALLAPPTTRLAPSRPLLPPAAHGPAVIVLVGPTGSGKTTTIAKLANHPRVFGGRRVGLLTLDTYRVGGVEQSRLYAEISKLPLEVVYEDRELEAAVRRLRDCEVILVDTPGRSPTARRDRAALAERIRALRPFDVHLTLPAWLPLESARRVLAEHRAYGVNHLLATKVDEAPDAGAPFGLAHATGLPMAWFTDGQEVPADLKPAAARVKAAGIAVAA